MRQKTVEQALAPYSIFLCTSRLCHDTGLSDIGELQCYKTAQTALNPVIKLNCIQLPQPLPGNFLLNFRSVGQLHL